MQSSEIENLTYGNQLPPNSIDSIISQLMNSSVPIKPLKYDHPEYDFETICISIREAVFLKKGVNSHTNRPISSIHAGGFSSCILLHIQNHISEESFTVHVDVSCVLNIPKIVSLFDNQETFKFNIYFFKFDNCPNNRIDEFINKDGEVFKEYQKERLTKGNMKTLRNTMAEIIRFRDENKNCKIDIQFFNCQQFLKDGKLGGTAFILNLEKGTASLDNSGSPFGLGGKYYPPVAKDDVFRTLIHTRNAYIHDYYTCILLKNPSEFIMIYNNKTKEEFLPPISERFSYAVNKIGLTEGKNEVIRKMFDLSKVDFKLSMEFGEFFRIREELLEYMKLYPFPQNALSIAPHSSLFDNPRFYENLKQTLKKEYDLDNDSLQELEKGLRRAATITKITKKETEDIPYNHAHKIHDFLALGVDINAKNSEGKTALHLAIEKNNFPFVKELLKKGARADIPDNKNKTVFDYGLHSVTNPMIHYQLSLHANSIGNKRLMLELLEKCYKICSTTNLPIPDILFDLGYEYENIKKTQKSLDCFTLAVKIFPNNPSAHYNLGQAIYREGNLEMAREKFLKSYELFMSDTETTIKQLQMLASSLRQVGCIDEALECTKEIVNKKIKHPVPISVPPKATSTSQGQPISVLACNSLMFQQNKSQQSSDVVPTKTEHSFNNPPGY